jgi:translocation and assembly module TamA
MRFRTLLIFCALLLSPKAWADIDVSIEGLTGPELKNVEQRLSIEAAAERPDLDEGLVQRLHAQADEDIRTALQPFGYYNVEIETNAPQKDGNDWKVRYVIHTGPPTLITQVDVAVDGEGHDFPGLQTVLQNLPLKTGERLLHSHYETTKARLLDAAFNGGFLDAKLSSSELRVDPDIQSAEIELKLTTGPRYYIGPITLEVQKLKLENIERYLTIEEGQPFSPQQVLDTQFALSDLDYFQTVEIEPRRDQAIGRYIPITIHTTLRKNARYQFGVGYGTDTGVRGTIGAEFRRINDYGHKVITDLRLSQIKNSIGAEYRIPVGRKATDYLNFSTTYSQEDIADGNATKYGIGSSLYRSLGFWQRRVYLEFTRELSTLGDISQTTDLLTPGVSLTHSTLDDPIRTREGWSLFLDVHGANKYALSDADFLQLHSTLRGAYPLGERARILGRVEMGWSIVADLSSLPATQRFFAGGDQSVRGYSYQSIGPKDSAGKATGGKYLSVFSIESDYRILDDWALAAFYDVGGVDDNPTPKLLRGVGLGVRYLAPIGDIRVDLAHPLDDPDTAIRLHVGIRVGL